MPQALLLMSDPSVTQLSPYHLQQKIKLSYGSEGKVNANPCKRVLIYDENEGSTSTRFMKVIMLKKFTFV